MSERDDTCRDPLAGMDEGERRFWEKLEADEASEARTVKWDKEQTDYLLGRLGKTFDELEADEPRR